jgi:hypothetical protein
MNTVMVKKNGISYPQRLPKSRNFTMKMKNINRAILVIMMLSLVFPTISAHAAELDFDSASR